jgi:hypothetical protein
MDHFIGHQQALIKNNICIAVLVFNEHDDALMTETFSKFDYDFVVDLCEIKKEASLDSAWDGFKFNIQPFASWILGEDLDWHPPVPKPEGSYIWDEENQVWVEYTPLEDGSTEI